LLGSGFGGGGGGELEGGDRLLYVRMSQPSIVSKDINFSTK